MSDKKVGGAVHDFSRYSGAVRAVLEAQSTLGRCMVGKQPQEWTQLHLTIGQIKLLMTLASKPGLTVSQLAERLNVGKPAASLLIDRPVRLGLARRTEDANDRRRTLITLTDAGVELVTRLRQGNLDQLAAWLQTMEPADLAALRRGMEALAAIAAASVEASGDETSQEPSVSVGVTNGSVNRDE